MNDFVRDWVRLGLGRTSEQDMTYSLGFISFFFQMQLETFFLIFCIQVVVAERVMFASCGGTPAFTLFYETDDGGGSGWS